MRAVLVIVGSSIVVPPNSNPNPQHHRSHKPSLPTTTFLSPPKPSSSSSSATSRPPLLSTVRWDLDSRRRSRLKYYADLASRLAENKRLDEFLMIAESVLASGVEPSTFVSLLSVDAVSAGIAKSLGHGKIWSVIEVLTSVRNLGIRPVQLFDYFAMEALANECLRIVSFLEVQEVVDLMETLAGFCFSIKKLVEPSDIIKICVNKRKPNESIRYACIFPDAHVMFCNIIHEFGKKRDLVSALTVFKASKQKLSSPNMYAYRTVIDVCGLCGDYLKSRSIYKELLAQNITPNIYVFNSLMNVNSHDLGYTLNVYKHMQDLGVAPDMASYNILLKSCCLASRVDLAQDIYREVQHLESAGALKLDVFTYSTIIKVFADAKLWQMALKIKEDMLSAAVTPNTVTWSSLISSCANAGLVEQAMQLFEEMLMVGCEPNTQCCNILLHACVEACQFDRAFRLFQCWKGSGLQKAFVRTHHGKTDAPENCNTSMSNCEVGSHHSRFVMRVPFKPTTSTYNILMKACGTDYFRVKSLMEEMKTVGLSPNHISWSILIDACGGSGNVGGAMRVLKSMREDGVRPDVVAYTTAIKICVKSRNLKIAFSLYEEMKRYEIQPNLVTYNTLLRARSRYGSLQEVQQCLAVYQDMRKAGYKSNDYYLKQLIEEWCEGVIQDNNQNRCHSSSYNRTDLGGPQSLLLEKVAAQLQKGNAESLAIDLQGLTKVQWI
ncbi:pentatricopeptide repeat-containing protein At5g02830, chloroplastic isoform X2 [Cornus florida]|uniref:pentatricopeptide repeat-containing protein At5g02830, chloroplastic isoform X2 n=1 Tax=Cornus florida TaxID=4283 RepID=UPI00289AA9AF|nr:pentatricopeptide repeat-containing protein At5g02830, chloroplastic isoform X2 [Cornus florida]